MKIQSVEDLGALIIGALDQTNSGCGLQLWRPFHKPTLASLELVAEISYLLVTARELAQRFDVIGCHRVSFWLGARGADKRWRHRCHPPFSGRAGSHVRHGGVGEFDQLERPLRGASVTAIATARSGAPPARPSSVTAAGRDL
jgi:hypothetical protein